MTNPLPVDVFSSELLPGEGVQWTGRPNAAVVFHKDDWAMVPFISDCCPATRAGSKAGFVAWPKRLVSRPIGHQSGGRVNGDLIRVGHGRQSSSGTFVIYWCRKREARSLEL